MVSRFKLVLLATVLLLPIGSRLCVAGRVLPAVAQTVDARKAEGDRLKQKHQSLLLFAGTGQPEVELLRSQELGKADTQSLFTKASWKFYSDGRFVFVPNTSRGQTIVVGTYVKAENTLEFQGQTLENGSSISVDGVVKLDGEAILLDAVFSLSASLRVSQIARISQRLSLQSPASSASEADLDHLIASSSIRFETPQQAQTLPDVRYEQIQGIWAPSVFDLSVEGKTEFAAFGPLPAQLGILPTESGKPNPLQISLMTTSKVANGDFTWGQGLADEELGVMQVSQGQIRVEFQSDQPNYNSGLNWYTTPKGASSNQTTPVVPEKATLTLSFQGDRVTGELHASGVYSADGSYNQTSTYEAKITGQRQRSQFAEQLRATLGASSFTGQWDSTIGNLEQLSLRQTGQQVSGTYTGFGGGTLKGTVQGNRLDFIWQDQRGKGWGFWRAIAGGGTLTGQWGQTTDKTQSQALLATWKLAPLSASKSLSLVDIDALRDLGNDLFSKGRCEQLIGIHKIMLNFYREQRLKDGLRGFGEGKFSTPLINEKYILNQLMTCAFQVNDYKQLLDSLNYALEVQRILSPGEVAKRRF
ncbi:MAG: hypothetical protein WCA07_04895, partial [Gloeobacterales cyanobacterium]